ncbi:MAG: DMT family transporter [Anaerolineales bacterium]
MKNMLFIGVLSALGTGMAIGVQATLTSRAGTLIGPIRTGLITNIVGGILAMVALGITFALPVRETGDIPTRAVVMMFLAGFFGVFIVIGVSFSLQRTGVTAGLGTIILGQMFVSTIVDTVGWGGAEPIPLTPSRVGGLLVMALAVYMLLPRN